MYQNKNNFKLWLMSLLLLSCSGGGNSISVLPTTANFDENASVNPQIDILWVVDPSRSMKQNVKNVSDNIQDFTSDFLTKNYDFQMGVISTAAWSSQVDDVDLASSLDVFGRLHKGECTDPSYNSNSPILTSDSSDTVSDFIARFRKNFDVYGRALNTSSCGLDFFTGYSSVSGNIFSDLTSGERSTISEYVSDERPLQSMKTFFDSNSSDGFLRENAFLAVIIVSDELDASRDSLEPSLSFDPNDPTNHTASSYVDYLSGLKQGDASKFSIYSITNEELETDTIKNISKTAALSSGGLAFDISLNSEEYKENLSTIKGEILSQSSIYGLTRVPRVDSIEVELISTTGKRSVPQASSEEGDGWQFIESYGDFGGLLLVGSYTPFPGDEVIVRFTPRNLNSGDFNEPYLSLSPKVIPENSEEGTTVGTVSLLNYDIEEEDELNFEITNSPSSFDIDPASGVVSVGADADLDVETAVKETIDVKLVLSPAEGPTTEYTQSLVVAIQDLPDTAPVANSASFEISESEASGDNIRITGLLSDYVSGRDSSEEHVFSFDSSPSEGSLSITDSSTGSFEYTVKKSDLNLNVGDPDYTFTINYTVVGTNNSESVDDDTDSASFTVTITPNNSAPFYANPVCPDGGYEFCDGSSIKPNNEDISFGSIPITASDIAVSGTASGDKNSLVSGNANFRTAANAQSYHEIEINFPDDKMYEVGCVRVHPDDSSLGNGIYQVLSPGDSPFVLTREVFPVDINSRSNLGNTPPADAEGACAQLSNDYFTIYTDRKYIGGKLKILRPSGSVNPQGHEELRIDQIEAFGIEARYNEINLDNHFSDLDLSSGDDLTYYVTDEYGEGPAPGWAFIEGSVLSLLPAASVDVRLGLIAVDESGAEAFSKIRVVGSGGGSVENADPISLLALEDYLRGGLSLRRWGGSSTATPPSCNIPSGSNNVIQHMEIDNFLFRSFNGDTGYYDITADIDQNIHMGDTTKSEPEDGWCNEPVYQDNKYPTASSSYCNQSPFSSNSGKVVPCINNARSYGEIYSGYFVPARTGVYKFRTKEIDNTIILRMATTEYHEDTQQLFIANWEDNQLEVALESILEPGESFNDTEARTSEFATSNTNFSAIPYDTSLFYDLNDITTDYSDGYVYLLQGNVYAFEMRFGEGGGSVRFDFEYNRKDVGGSWSGWKALDASVLVPNNGTSSYTPTFISVNSGTASFDASGLFYDVEQDILEYSARLVNADGTDFGDGSLTQIGLEIGVLDGELSGSLNSTYNNASDKPRVVFKASERYGLGETESLPIKFEN